MRPAAGRGLFEVEIWQGCEWVGGGGGSPGEHLVRWSTCSQSEALAFGGKLVRSGGWGPLSEKNDRFLGGLGCPLEGRLGVECGGLSPGEELCI